MKKKIATYAYTGVLKKITLFLFIITGLLIFQACKNKSSVKYELENASPYFTPLVDLNDESVWRGINFNLSAAEVKKLEKAKLYETTPDHLFYEFSYPEDSTTISEYANIQYFFDENGKLDIITSDIFMNDSTQESQLKNTFIQYFNQRFGSSETDSYNYEVWKGSYEDKTLKKEIYYSVALKKLKDEFGVTLEFLRE